MQGPRVAVVRALAAALVASLSVMIALPGVAGAAPRAPHGAPAGSAGTARAHAAGRATRPGRASRLPAGPTAPIGADADQLRTSWYSNEPGLAPANVNPTDFGQLFSTQLVGQVYAQPLVADGVLLAVTEANDAYGLDPTTGAIEWSHNFGTPWNPATMPGGGCFDLAPTIGITGTPVVDPSTGDAYFTTDIAQSDGTASWWMQGIDVTTGAELAGFPVQIAGTASDDPGLAFSAEQEMQRPGLALVNGTVYAGFGSHCDSYPWYGWIAAVSVTGTPQLTSLWSDEIGSDSGGGIWGPGGLVVGSSGDLFVATGNGNVPNPGPGLGVPQPEGLGECEVKLSTSGSVLSPSDYFCPYNALSLATGDVDLGSAAPMALPPGFGTSTTPNLLVQAGKYGEVYVLNRDNLGGMGPPAGPDDVVSESGPRGSVWSHPAVWPGDGGYVYIPTGGPGQGTTEGAGELDVYQRVVTGTTLSLNFVASVPNFDFGSSSPTVTSNGSDNGSAVVWIVQKAPNGVPDKLDAFAAVPTGGTGTGTLQPLWSATVGDAAKFNPPSAFGGVVYVGTGDNNNAGNNGAILGFGEIAGPPPITGSALGASATTLGASSQATASFQVTGPATVTAISVQNTTQGASTAFTAGTPSPPLPARLSGGDTFTVPVTFSPEILGTQDAALTLTVSFGGSSTGTVSVPVSGTGVSTGSPITSQPTSVNFGELAIGGAPATTTVTFTNHTGVATRLASLSLASGNSAPFSIVSGPSDGTPLAVDQSEQVTIQFAPPPTSGDFVQSFNDTLEIDTPAGNGAVPLAGSAAPPPKMVIAPPGVGFGLVAVGQSEERTFTISNVGGMAMTITGSQPPSTGGYSAVTTLSPGTVIAPHSNLIETVRFAPTAAGVSSTSWGITSNDGTGTHSVTISAKAVAWHLLAPPGGVGWRLNGSARLTGAGVQLTAATSSQAGSAYLTTALSTADLNVSFEVSMSGGTGGEGVTLALANSVRRLAYQQVGGDGAGLGFTGVAGDAIAMHTYPSITNPSGNSIGLVTGTGAKGNLLWANADNAIANLRAGAVLVEVEIRSDSVCVTMNGTHLFTIRRALPKFVFLGFTGSTGTVTDVHQVSNIQIASGRNL